MSLKLSIIQKIGEAEKTVNLEAATTNDEHIRMALDGVFGLFGVSKSNYKPENISNPIVSEHAVKKLEDLKMKQAEEVTRAKEESSPLTLPAPWKRPTEQLGRPRTVELIGSERTLSLSIGEKLAEAAESKPEQPEWYKTGIKYKDGVPHYRARYWCQKCRHQGTQYVSLDVRVTECHECKAEHELRPANGIVDDNGIPDRDRFGNFFRADRLAETEV